MRIVLVAALLLPGSALAAQPLDREIDPVIVAGSQLGALAGVPESALRMVAVRKGALRTIPFQLDERDEEGRYVVPSGKWRTKDEDEGRVDANDELLFMAFDMGPAWEGAWPDGVRRIVAISAQEPADPSRSGHAYALAFAPGKAPPLALGDYVSFDGDKDQVDARDYVLGNTPGTTLFDTLVLKGRRGKSKRDVFDRIKLRAHIEPHIGPTFDVDESRFIGGVLAFKDGPVRVIKRAQVRFKLFGSLTIRTDINDSLFYPSWYRLEKKVGAPMDVDTLFEKVTLSVLADFGSGARGMTFYSALWPEGVPVDGEMSEAERKVGSDGRSSQWHALSRYTASFIERTTWDPAYKIVRQERYIDDRGTKLTPESLKGTTPTFGYEVDLSHLKSGEYAFTTIIVVPPKRYRPGDEKRYLRVADAPLKITTRGVSLPGP